jgi:hypothetical protein
MKNDETSNRVPGSAECSEMTTGPEVGGAEGLAVESNDDARVAARSVQSFELSWTIHPLLERKRTSLLLLVLLFAVWIWVYIASEFDPIMTGISVILLLGTLSPYFLKTTYHLDAEGITQTRGRMVMKKRWKEFRRYIPGKTWVLLSPFEYPTRLDSFRGLTLLVNSSQRDRVLDIVRQKIRLPKSSNDHRG